MVLFYSITNQEDLHWFQMAIKMHRPSLGHKPHKSTEPSSSSPTTSPKPYGHLCLSFSVSPQRFNFLCARWHHRRKFEGGRTKKCLSLDLHDRKRWIYKYKQTQQTQAKRLGFTLSVAIQKQQLILKLAPLKPKTLPLPPSLLVSWWWWSPGDLRLQEWPLRLIVIVLRGPLLLSALD